MSLVFHAGVKRVNEQSKLIHFYCNGCAIKLTLNCSKTMPIYSDSKRELTNEAFFQGHS